jgi:hypothetical protein
MQAHLFEQVFEGLTRHRNRQVAHKTSRAHISSRLRGAKAGRKQIVGRSCAEKRKSMYVKAIDETFATVFRRPSRLAGVLISQWCTGMTSRGLFAREGYSS